MEVQETDQGIIVVARVVPRSAGFRLLLRNGGMVIEVSGPPEGGRANQEIMRELPRMLRCDVQILRGSGSRKKLLLLKGISQKELEAVLETHQP